MRSSIPSGYILSGVLNIRAFRPIHMPKYAKIIRKIHSQSSFPWKGASVTTGYAFSYQDMPVYQSITVKVPLTVPWHNSQLALNDPLLLTSHPLKKCRKWAKKEKEKRKKKKAVWKEKVRRVVSQYAESYGHYLEGSWQAEEMAWQDLVELNNEKWEVPHLKRNISCGSTAWGSVG